MQYLGDAVAFQRDDALISLIAVLGIQRDDETAVAHHIPQRACWFALPLGRGANFQIAGTFHDQQLHRPFAVYLQDHGAFQFQRGGKQHGCGTQLAHQVAQKRRVIVPLDHVLPDRVEPHDFAAQRRMLKQETTQGIR